MSQPKPGWALVVSLMKKKRKESQYWCQFVQNAFWVTSLCTAVRTDGTDCSMQYVQHVVHTVCSTQKAVLKTAMVWVTGNRSWVDVSHWQTVSVCILLLFCYLRVTVFKVPVNTRNNTTTTSSEQTITVHAKNGKFDRDVSCTIRQGCMGFSVDSCKEIQRI